eukprot:GEMP01003349.1.p1 GENE.GEMP01003349.1~~GEMP01003349.1.p1  ORF type:complete len:699 (+),score=160.76 GEMP01003349.1:185-2281(+)
MPVTPSYDQDDYEVVHEEISREEALMVMIAYATADIERLEVGVTSRVAMNERDDEIVANYYAITERKRVELAALQAEYRQLVQMQNGAPISDSSPRLDSPIRPLSSDDHPHSRVPELSNSRSRTPSPRQPPPSSPSPMQPPLSYPSPSPKQSPLSSPRQSTPAATPRQSSSKLAITPWKMPRRSPRAPVDPLPCSPELISSRSSIPSSRQPPLSYPSPSPKQPPLSSPRQPKPAATPRQSPRTLATPQEMPRRSTRASCSTTATANTATRKQTTPRVATPSDAPLDSQPRRRRPHNPRLSPADAPPFVLMSPQLNAMVEPQHPGPNGPGTPRFPDLPPPLKRASTRVSAKKVEDRGMKVPSMGEEAGGLEKAHGSRQRSRQSAVAPNGSRSTVTMSELAVDLTQVRARCHARDAQAAPDAAPKLRIADLAEDAVRVPASRQSRSAQTGDRTASSLSSTTARTTGFSSGCPSLPQRSPRTPRKQASPQVDKSAPLSNILALSSAVPKRASTNRASTAESASSVSARGSLHGKPARRGKQHARPRLPMEQMSLGTPVAPPPSPQIGITEVLDADRRSTLAGSIITDTPVSSSKQRAGGRQSVFTVEESTKWDMAGANQPSRRRARTQRLDDSPRKMPYHEWEDNFPPVSFPPEYELTSFCLSNFWRVRPPPKRKRSWSDKLYLLRRRTMRKIRNKLCSWL